MSNQIPYEIIGQPFTLWVAPVGTAFPTLDDTPGVAWTKVGTSGDRNYGEDGVKVSHSQSIEKFRPLGSTGARKAFRTEEECTITMTLADVTLEQYRMAMNFNTVSTVAAESGEVGYKKIGLSRGLDVEQRALLVRGSKSPYGSDYAMQYEVPVAIETASQEVAWQKGEPAMLELMFEALEDPDASSDDERFGRLLTQNAEAGT